MATTTNVASNINEWAQDMMTTMRDRAQMQMRLRLVSGPYLFYF